MAAHDLQIDPWTYHVATGEHRLAGAFALLHDAYVARGLQQPTRGRLRVTPQHLLAESRVLVACRDSAVVGTVTVTVDSPARLPLDKDYPEAIDRLRRSGARVAEVGSLAVDRRHRHQQLAVALGWLSLSACKHLLAATHVVIGINPNVADYYRAMWGFTRIGEPRHHAELDAPVEGMQLSLAELECFVAAQRGSAHADLLAPWPCFSASSAPRLSATAFRRLFVEGSDVLHMLDPATRRHLATQRAIDGTQSATSAQLTGSR